MSDFWTWTGVAYALIAMATLGLFSYFVFRDHFDEEVGLWPIVVFALIWPIMFPMAIGAELAGRSRRAVSPPQPEKDAGNGL